MSCKAGLRGVTMATIMVGMAASVPAHAELPEPVRAMIDAAIATGDETKVRTVTEIARATNPGDQEEIDAIVANFEAGVAARKAAEAEAKVVYDNMAQAASRYLAVNLVSMGSVPADEYLQRAARLGRAVVDAFPLAGASVAFRQLAGRFALAGSPSVARSL